MMVEPLAGPAGWLAAMACNERSLESFVAVHNSILEILRVSPLHALCLLLLTHLLLFN